MGGGLAPRLRGLAAGAHRQCRARAASARCLWRGHGRPPSGASGRTSGTRAGWALQRALLQHLEKSGDEPDEGIWEVRGPRLHFTYSKVMAWVAFDRACKPAEAFSLDGPVDRWRASAATRSTTEICVKGFDPELGSFVQAYGSKQLDASLLLLPAVGFPAAGRPPRSRHHRGDRAAPRCRTASSCATTRRRRTTACHRARARSWPAASGSPTPMSCSGPDRRSAHRSSIASWPFATMSDSWPRNTTRRHFGQLGNFPQAFSTSRWSIPPTI